MHTYNSVQLYYYRDREASLFPAFRLRQVKPSGKTHVSLCMHSCRSVRRGCVWENTSSNNIFRNEKNILIVQALTGRRRHLLCHVGRRLDWIRLSKV